jgi:hypothetical protein
VPRHPLGITYDPIELRLTVDGAATISRRCASRAARSLTANGSAAAPGAPLLRPASAAA